MQAHEDRRSDHEVDALARVIGTDARYPGDPRGLDSGERASLARLDPEAPRPSQLGALAKVLIRSGLNPERWTAGAWQRWALIAQGIALSGHDGHRSLGESLFDAGVSEARVTRLLTARGDALRQNVPRVVRLMAARGQPPNWRELADLILLDGSDEVAAEACRLRIASRYYTAHHRVSND